MSVTMAETPQHPGKGGRRHRFADLYHERTNYQFIDRSWRWLLLSGSYFVLFWSTAGQTPGMRLMHVRVLDRHGDPPGLGRSLVRFVGLLLAIVPLFAGFLPVLFDERRRGLHDYLAGTVVHDLDHLPAAVYPEAFEPAPT